MGPAINLILAFVCGITIFILNNINELFSEYIDCALFYGVTINIVFAGFNMLPIAPLDGEKVFSSFLPDRLYNKLQNSRVYKWVGSSLIVLILLFLLGLQYVLPFI